MHANLGPLEEASSGLLAVHSPGFNTKVLHVEGHRSKNRLATKEKVETLLDFEYKLQYKQDLLFNFIMFVEIKHILCREGKLEKGRKETLHRDKEGVH